MTKLTSTHTTLLCSLLVAGGAYSATVNCTGSSGDASAIQSAMNAGGTVTISGACSLTSRINVTKPVIVNGSATLNVLPSLDYVFALNSDNVTFNGLTFVQGGIYATGVSTQKRSNITITNCAFRDFTSFNYKAGIETDRIAYNWNITANRFSNFWQGGFANQTSNPLDSYSSVAGIVIWGGLDHTFIYDNSFDGFESDSMHFFSLGLGANSGGYTASNVVISANVFTRQHRMAIEWQDFPNGLSACAGGCNTTRAITTGTVISKNYYHLPLWPYWGSFPFSIPTAGDNGQYINNTLLLEADLEPSNRIHGEGYAWELSQLNHNLNLQGNVASSLVPNRYWFLAVANYPPGSATNVYRNNMFCGAIRAPVIDQNGPHTEVANYVHTSTTAPVGTCPGGVGTATSSIQIAFTTPNNQTLLAGDIGTWDVYVISNLSVNAVQFLLDNSATPVVTQEIQDVNHNFPSDRKWLYHASINTSGTAPGQHTIKASATDVLRATQATLQTFTVN